MLSLLIRLLYGVPTSDCNRGMRAILASRYHDLRLRSPGMEYASELLIRAGMHGLKYAEVPIHFRKDGRSRPPHLRRWRDGWRHLRFILANGPVAPVVGIPFFASPTLLSCANVLSVQRLSNPSSRFSYHTAFIAAALAVPFLLFTVSTVLIKLALHDSHQVESQLIRRMATWGERSYPLWRPGLLRIGTRRIGAACLALEPSRLGQSGRGERHHPHCGLHDFRRGLV